ncbi:hypothetical protein HPB51_009538 [Rhipicephalus microplus]|uniref:MULE transposase domain-containing protein n=1 Tax=Rhipicephalus microplus TaxID=6941 RepID=A0A9J6F209_RHIMP|nr:hypothetical protein HPB51_009538 [Rhipicephalus microplus]
MRLKWAKIVFKRPAVIPHNFPGTHISVTRGGRSTCWGRGYPIIQRTHNLELARDIDFVDSTASCDTTKCTVTVVLTATKAGAVPLAVLIHKEQSTDGYLATFKLLKEAHSLCFGGQPAPQVLMSDNSSAEKATLQQTWPSASQLLCHFHVAQVEWRWLTTSRNCVDKDQRRRFMSAFQLASFFEI